MRTTSPHSRLVTSACVVLQLDIVIVSVFGYWISSMFTDFIMSSVIVCMLCPLCLTGFGRNHDSIGCFVCPLSKLITSFVLECKRCWITSLCITHLSGLYIFHIDDRLVIMRHNR